jgi:hypothetical protein
MKEVPLAAHGGAAFRVRVGVGPIAGVRAEFPRLLLASLLLGELPIRDAMVGVAVLD